MNRISTNHTGSRTIFRIEGDLRGESVLELERSWRKESKQSPRSMCIDLRSAGKIGNAGRILLNEMFGTRIEVLIPIKHRENKV